MAAEHAASSSLLVDRLFRTQSARLIAHFVRRFGPARIQLAEDVVQEALTKALQQWPYDGVPANPGGWLFRVATNHAIDGLKRDASFARKSAAIAYELGQDRGGQGLSRGDSEDDDELHMILMCCHPSLAREAQVALSLRTVGGLGVREIARALLSDERAVAQRLVRAKRTLRQVRGTIALSATRARTIRMNTVLDVLYLLYNEGYGAHAGENLIRADLCREALRIGQLVTSARSTATPRAHALVALMAFHSARERARVNGAGELVRLHEQDRALWDPALIRLGFRHLDSAMDGDRETAFHLQAAIAATHASSTTARTDWPAILELYDALVAQTPSVIVRLNRAVAVSKVRGPVVALAELDAISMDRSVARYHLLPAVRADLLVELGRLKAAARAYRDALRLAGTGAERRFLRRQLERIS